MCANAGGRPISLIDGQYANGTLDPFSYDCYTVQVPASADAELRLFMTSFSGDAELFVSSSSQPSNMSYTWRGYDAGTSSIVVNRSDPAWCAPPCTYYISAYSHEYYAIFNLVATFHGDNSAIAVGRNHPVNALTPRGGRQLFYYRPRNFEQLRGIRFTTTPSYGAAVILVSVGLDGDIAVPSRYPTFANATWQSYSAFAGAFLHVWHTDPAFQSQCSPISKDPDAYTGCVYLISVVQIFAHSTQYTLLVTQNSPVAAIDQQDRFQDQHIEPRQPRALHPHCVRRASTSTTRRTSWSAALSSTSRSPRSQARATCLSPRRPTRTTPTRRRPWRTWPTAH